MTNFLDPVHGCNGDTVAHRRQFLRAAAIATGGILITAGRDEAGGQVIVPGHGGMSRSPQSAGNFPAEGAFDGLFQAPATTTMVPERKNIALLPDAELTNFRQAFSALGAPAGAIYQSWVNLHVSNCQHNNNLIWPWHRAYLYYFEKRLQLANPSADPPVTIPYWAYDAEDSVASAVPPRSLPVPYRSASSCQFCEIGVSEIGEIR